MVILGLLSGLTTIELSKFIIWSLDKNITGLVHATNTGNK